MPNRKTAKIEIRNLKCFGIIAREIAEEYPEYENYLASFEQDERKKNAQLLTNFD